MATTFWLSIYGVYIGATWRKRLNRPCAAAMRPYVKLFSALVLLSDPCGSELPVSRPALSARSPVKTLNYYTIKTVSVRNAEDFLYVFCSLPNVHLQGGPVKSQ